jgi:hypothetical protein
VVIRVPPGGRPNLSTPQISIADHIAHAYFLNDADMAVVAIREAFDLL